MLNKKTQKNTEAKSTKLEAKSKNENKNGKVLSGVVSSTKMTDTIVVAVNRYHKHPVYGKFINTRKKYKVHDAGNTAKVGDKVSIIETKPISKDKKFRLLEITTSAPVVDLGDEDANGEDVTSTEDKK